ncbi:Lipopolysaccharide core heptosyltransferase I [hydrothermal vent metagenome]|uniref:Lipopolysaccharide core heptosyltransferase I n=1 Tax=hydrothermal vent metagenome TaxID=652676 RepID=A0A3B1CUV7_9ZZZZ
MPLSSHRFRKILIVKPSSLGDIIHALPLLNAVKITLPDSEVHWVVAKGFEGVLQGHPMIKRLWVIHKEDWKRPSRLISTVSELGALFRGLRFEKYDLVIDLQGLLRSGFITAMSGAALRVGFSDARELSPFFYNLKVRGGTGIHAVERYLKLASLIGIDTDEVDFPLPMIQDALRPEGPYYVVVPGARWPTKRWPVEYFVDAIKALPTTAVIVGSREDVDIAGEIALNTEGHSINMAGKTDLKSLFSIIKGASFILSNDSGPMHIGAALSVPVYAMFGPTSEVLTGPYGDGHRVFRADIACSPCFRKKCETMKCMREITPVEVINAITADRVQFAA